MIVFGDFLKISVEGVVGSGCQSFVWDVSEHPDGESVWSGLEDHNVLDGNWEFGNWVRELRERYHAWEFPSIENTEVDFVCFDKSIWSFMVYALWDFRMRLPSSLGIEEYQTLKTLFLTLTEDVDLPDAVLYFECSVEKSPLPKNSFWTLDEMYETWLGRMESKGVLVIRIPPHSYVGLGQEYFTNKLIDETLGRLRSKPL